MNEYLKTHPFDLYELNLIRQVAVLSSFTKAAASMGVTQSAITRQIRGVEARLEVQLFERTTRKVRLTDAGKDLLEKTEGVFQKLQSAVETMREKHLNHPKSIRIGISPGMGIGIFPGFFAQYVRAHPDYRIKLEMHDDEHLLRNLESEKIDFAVFSPGSTHSPHLKVYRAFHDTFVLITPEKCVLKPAQLKNPKVLSGLRWLMWDERDFIGNSMRLWLKRQGIVPVDFLSMPHPDLTIQMVILGYGVALIPNRLLALYRSKRSFNVYSLTKPFKRKIMIVGRKEKNIPLHHRQFIDAILFANQS